MATTTRRRLIALAGGALATSTAGVAAPSVARAQSMVKWRLQSSFPKSLEIVWSGAEVLAREVKAMSAGRFEIALYPAVGHDESPAAIEAVAAGRVEMCHTLAAFNIAKDPTFALITAMPFGLDARLITAFNDEQGGKALINGFLTGHGLVALPGGNLGAAMGGWFHREIAMPEDLAGLKIRSTGLAARVLKALGATPVTLAPVDIRGALERREIDAAHWMGPFDDDAMGLWRAARNYYYPGWWSGGTALHFLVSSSSHDALPAELKAILAAAAAVADRHVLARYDAMSTVALRRLAAGGAELRSFPEPVLDAAFKAASETLDAIAAGNAPFKALLQALRRARADGYLWHQVAEHAFSTYMMVQQRKGRL
ncbi:MAG: ABC transporter substrate-binding protein [Hyphomicrobiaceae bacterium]